METTTKTTTEYEHLLPEDKNKDQLIKAATTRLRQKLLEHKYQTLIADIVEMQSKLDIIKMETMVSLQSIDDSQLHLDHFDRKLDQHKAQLKKATSTITSSSIPLKRRDPAVGLCLSLSSFTSTLSSMLSFGGDPQHEPKDYFSVEKRPNLPVFKQLSSCGDMSSSSYTFDMHSTTENTPTPGKGLLVLHSIQNSTMDVINKRNAFDETMSFLNDLASDSDDGGFRQDIIQLLDTIHYTNHSNSNHHIDTLSTTTASSLSPSPDHTISIKDMGCAILYTTWRWLRFALIMMLAIMINLWNGPSLL